MLESWKIQLNELSYSQKAKKLTQSFSVLVVTKKPLRTKDEPEATHQSAEGLSLEDYFRHFVLDHQESLNETQLSKKLGISRKSLWERRQKYGIPRKKKS